MHNSILLAPSVTPWESTLAGVTANNPAVRLYHYENRNSTSVLQRYDQYYLDLEYSNQQNMAVWVLGYNSYELGLETLESNQLWDLFHRLRKNETLFQFYYRNNAVNYPTPPCNEICKAMHLCSIASVKYEDYWYCINKSF